MSGGRFFPYLVLRLKRAARFLPPVLFVSALLLAALGAFGLAAAENRSGDEALQKVRIGIVGDVEGNSWLRLGFYALENLDSSKYELSFIRTEGEDEARRMMGAGELNSYLVIPEGFIEALAYGEELTPLRYVSTEGAVGVGTALTNEVARAVAKLVLEAENAIYGGQYYVADHIPGRNPYEVGDALVERYLDAILSREDLFVTELAGVSRGLGFFEYYLCGMLVLFLLLWGVGCGPLCSRREPEQRRMLRAAGLSGAGQVLAEYLAYMALLFVSFLLVLAVCALGLRVAPELLEALDLDEETFWFHARRSVYPALMLGAMQLLLFELASGAVSGLLLQFLTAVALAYLSGCFYPSGFFPEVLRRFGAALPSGVAFSWIGGDEPLSALWIGLYLALFLILLALARSRSFWRGGAGE